jgi:phosphoglycolate phosphatase-like HAD superfamily hydrolase
MPDKFVFLDFDNTLSDQFRFNTQYVREIGALLAPQFGGEPEAWERAAIAMLETLERDYIARFGGNPLAGYCAWLEEARFTAAERLFGGMGLPVPSSVRDLGMETQFRALSACDATFPGARDALLTLVEDGCRVQIASGQESEWLRAALTGAGLAEYTERIFGPDLVDCAKEGPEYYARLFAATGAQAGEALVVDDQPEPLRWAMRTGAKVVQARLSTERHYETVPGVAAVLTDLRDLPGLAKRILG